jgi:cytochrome P450
MSTIECLPLTDVNIDAATLGQLGLLKVAERALKTAGGDAVRLRFPGDRTVVLLAAPHYAAYWQDHTEVFEKAVFRPDTGAGLTRQVLGHTLLTSPDGPKWQEMRREMTGLLALAKPWFQRPLAKATAQLAAALQRGEGALLDHCIAWSMRAICDPILGNAKLDRSAHDIVLALNDGFVARLEGQPQPSNLQQRYAAFLARVAQERGADSIAALVMETEQDHAEASLRSVVGGLLAGSLHINALALYWLLVQVAADVGLQDALAAEAALGQPLCRALDAPLAFATVRESQRLRPTMAFIERQVTQNCQIGTVQLMAGDTVLFSPWFAQRDALAWPDPLRFDPWRFINSRKMQAGSNLPFGLGPRQCPGANLVNQQLTYVLSALCRDGHLSLGPETRPGDLASLFRVNLEPRGRVRLTLAPRQPSEPVVIPVPKEEPHAC